MAGHTFALLPVTTITTALTGSVAATDVLGPGDDDAFRAPRSVTLQATFVYGSGGTTAKAWVQTSLDGGATWVDVANFAFATASAVKVSSLTDGIAPASQAFAPTDGTLADNTIVQGVLGSFWRAKLTTTGTYAGDTTLGIRLVVRG